MYDLVVKNGKAYIDSRWTRDFIYVKDGRIALISPDNFPAKKEIDATGLEVVPGLIDPHVHFDLNLGFIRSVDDFDWGSRAAAFGGVTTIVDFLDPVSNAAELEKAFSLRAEQARHCHVDYHFHATIKQPDGNLEEFVRTMKKLGMHTIKLFTTYSDSGRRTGDEHIIELLKLSEKYKVLIMAHVENDAEITLDPTYTYRDLTRSRPSHSETSEALKLAGFVRQHGGYLYMVHLSSGRTLEALVNGFSDILNKRMFIESCPQYFTLNDESLKRADGYLYTFAPPLRSEEERKLLIRHKSHVDTIGTDHCAFNKADKTKERLSDMPLGIGGIEHSFALMRLHYGDGVINKMSARVATLMGLERKGRIALGYDADFAFFKSNPDYMIKENHGRADYSVYDGLRSTGHFVTTMVRGMYVVRDGSFVKHQGRFLKGRDTP